MLPVPDSFTFDYDGSDLVYGRGCIDRVGEHLAERGLERALVVCGSNVGANPDVMEPLKRGLGDRLAGVFDETTPAKAAGTAYDGIDAVRTHDADVLVGVGGGSSLDIARGISALRADGRSLDDLRAEAGADGESRPVGGGDDVLPVVAVPTTFAGADISHGGSLDVSAGESSGDVRRVSIREPRARPLAMFYDPDLFETTPTGALAGSAMNGFDKGIETIYAADATPITDGTAVHGLRLLTDALPRLSGDDPGVMERAVSGIVLVQFRRKASIVHAFGHGFARRYPVQQGVVHAIVVPHVLGYVLDEVDARRALIAEGLGVDAAPLTDAELADAIVAAVRDVRDSLRVPTRLRALDPVDRDDFPAIAEFIRDDSPMRRAPAGLDPTAEEIEAILHEAW